MSRARGSFQRGEAVVLCVWQPVDVGIRADRRRDTLVSARRQKYGGRWRSHVRETSLARRAGFRARSLAVEAAPT